jgi:hypothetical protein
MLPNEGVDFVKRSMIPKTTSNARLDIFVRHIGDTSER